MKQINYSAFGLSIASELPLPELLTSSEKLTHTADVRVTFGKVSKGGINEANMAYPYYQSNEHSLWLNIPNVARYLVTHGNSITIEPVVSGNEDNIRLFLLGSCMGGILMQRNLLPLHANAIKVGYHCISFTGPSGIGKSTLSAAFMKRGYCVLADDVCAINQENLVVPSYPHIKLWMDTTQNFGIKTDMLRKISPDLDKFSVPLKEQFQRSCLPLKKVYVLNSHDLNTFEFKKLKSVEKVPALQHNIYRYYYLKNFGKTKKHIQRIAQLASLVDVTQITRPSTGFQLDGLIEAIENDLS